MEKKKQEDPGLAVRMNRRRFLHFLSGTVLGTVAVGLGGLTYIHKVEPAWFEVVPVALPLPRLHPAFDGFRLVQISDIHLSEALTSAQVAEISQLVLQMKPDLVAITGDFVDETRDLQRSLADLAYALRPLVSTVQTIAVLGNHDYWVGPGAIRAMLRQEDIRELANQVMTLERGSARLHIAGVDDVWESKARISKVLEQIPDKENSAVLLAHEPDYADVAAASARFDLQISGHSHGGQVVLPFVGPPILPRFARKYPSGLYRIKNMFHYTNRGLGTIAPRVRFNCRPEITVYTFNSSQEADPADI